MQDFQPISLAIAYIEEHLTGPLSLQQAAQVAGYSPFHFHRLFHALTGESFAAYVRRRRLAEAARVLVGSDQRTLDVALEYQYESQEAFTRAFRRQFGVTPGQYRRWGPAGVLAGQPPQSSALGGNCMEPRIVEKGSFKLVGMIYHGQNKSNEIGQLWTEFDRLLDQIPYRQNKDSYYGLCFGMEKGNPAFSYLAALPVDRFDEVPLDMVAKTVPAQTYAVFTHRGPTSKILETYDYGYGTWLPASEYEPAASFDFEFYDDRFTGPDDPNSQIDIYIPIKRKA